MMSAAPQAVVGFDPLRDKSYRATGLGPDIAAFLAWTESAGMSERTRDQYERDLAKGALMFPDRERETLEREDALHIAASFKTAERRVRVAAWRSFYRFLSVVYDVDKDPFRAVPQFRRQQQRVHDIFSDAEAELLRGLPEPDGTLMAILLDAGLRKSEARAFQLRHYRPDPSDARPWGSLVVLDGKGRKDRSIRATKRIATGIAEMHVTEGLSDRDHLWYGHRANAISRTVTRQTKIGDGTFARWWGSPDGEIPGCIGLAGVRYRNPHMTRHTFATNWLRAGGKLERLSIAMGHASIRTTFDLYGHLDDGDIDADLALIEARS